MVSLCVVEFFWRVYEVCEQHFVHNFPATAFTRLLKRGRTSGLRLLDTQYNTIKCSINCHNFWARWIDDGTNSDIINDLEWRQKRQCTVVYIVLLLRSAMEARYPTGYLDTKIGVVDQASLASIQLRASSSARRRPHLVINKDEQLRNGAWSAASPCFIVLFILSPIRLWRRPPLGGRTCYLEVSLSL